ncbi:hypothetical protein [Cytobacillus massiliigabonensis]|uniref:hypothetical protein n=1 Tax=Cytobacillus massiliigabonensis TaxID=1871011 RepID=UPI000C851373|nr:hypothetical protein [Cytobacillus massiliigabonensis]
MTIDKASFEEGSYDVNNQLVIELTLSNDTFVRPFKYTNVEFTGDLSGLSISGYVHFGTSDSQIRLMLTGTITNDTGHGTITVKGDATESGKDSTVTVTIENADI